MRLCVRVLLRSCAVASLVPAAWKGGHVSERWTRRRVLLAGLGLGAGTVLSACRERSTPVSAPPPPPDPDVALVAAAIATEEQLLATYAATLTRHTSLSVVLSPLAAEHDAHLRALRERTPVASSPGSAAPSETAAGALVPVPAVAALARAALAAAETAAANDRGALALTASAPLARLLASMAAADAAHAALLGAA